MVLAWWWHCSGMVVGCFKEERETKEEEEREREREIVKK